MRTKYSRMLRLQLIDHSCGTVSMPHLVIDIWLLLSVEFALFFGFSIITSLIVMSSTRITSTTDQVGQYPVSCSRNPATAGPVRAPVQTKLFTKPKVLPISSPPIVFLSVAYPTIHAVVEPIAWRIRPMNIPSTGSYNGLPAVTSFIALL